MTDSRVPFLLGLTGSIGMGKSTVSGMFRDEGVPVFCADEVVHRLYSEGGAAVLPLAEAFPGAVISGAVDRRQLSQAVMGNQEALRRLEDIVHPLVHEDRRRWLKEHQHHSLLVLDIPLLFETDGAGMVDVVAVVSASAEVQRSRVLARPGMTQETLDAILARQTPDEEKRRRACFVFNTNETLAETQERVRALLKGLKGRKGFAFNQHMKDL